MTRQEKRKHEPLQKVGANAKLQEFLEVMQPPSKSKIWGNEDLGVIKADGAFGPESNLLVAADNQSDEGYEPVPKKRKRSQSVEKAVQASPLVKRHESPTDELAREVISEIISVPEEVAQQPETTGGATSDADWIRSRTSRLLGLVDDDDAVLRSPLPPTADGAKIGKDITPNTTELRNVSDVSSQTDKEASEVTPEVSKALENDIQEGNNLGRLFVRNLSYATTEDDIRAYFETYGALEEVSQDSYMLDFSSCDEYPDRDNLCYTCDVTRKSVLVDAS